MVMQQGDGHHWLRGDDDDDDDDSQVNLS